MIQKLFLILGLWGLPVLAQGAPSLAEGKPCYDMSPSACEVFYRTNEQRVKYRLPALGYHRTCFTMAQEQSADMAARSYFDHTRPSNGKVPGETFARRAARFGLAWAGENIALTQHGSEHAVVMWMNSPGHRANILNQNYTHFAVGYVNGRYTQIFTREVRPTTASSSASASVSRPSVAAAQAPSSVLNGNVGRRN